jgi:putative transcriptional regulator
MTKKISTQGHDIFDEMLEMAQALQGHALISKQDMAKMKLICQSPPEYTSENVMSIRVKKAKVSQSVFASVVSQRFSEERELFRLQIPIEIRWGRCK